MSMTKKEAFEIIEMLANVYNMELNDTKFNLWINFLCEDGDYEPSMKMAKKYIKAGNVYPPKIPNIMRKFPKTFKDDAYEITKVAVDYCKEKNKGIPYLITILKNWNKEGIDTVEKAKAKAAPKKRKQPKKDTDNFLERKRQELMGG